MLPFSGSIHSMNQYSATCDLGTVSDERIHPRDTGNAMSEGSSPSAIGAHSPSSRRLVDCASTADGDVVVVQPSFDDSTASSSSASSRASLSPTADCDGRSKPSPQVLEPQHDNAKTEANYEVAMSKSHDWQARSPGDDSKHATEGTRSAASPLKHGGHRSRRKGRGGNGHTRNLSAHFFDATSLKDEIELDEEAYGAHRELISTTGAQPSDQGETRTGGRKHRRMFSNDQSNPPYAHRRINSVGQSTAIHRGYHFSHGQPSPHRSGAHHHQRVDSAGLDILSAAVDAAKDELAEAASAGSPQRRNNGVGSSWEPPSTSLPPPLQQQLRGGSRDGPLHENHYPLMKPPPPPHHHAFPHQAISHHLQSAHRSPGPGSSAFGHPPGPPPPRSYHPPGPYSASYPPPPGYPHRGPHHPGVSYHGPHTYPHHGPPPSLYPPPPGPPPPAHGTSRAGIPPPPPHPYPVQYSQRPVDVYSSTPVVYPVSHGIASANQSNRLDPTMLREEEERQGESSEDSYHAKSTPKSSPRMRTQPKAWSPHVSTNESHAMNPMPAPPVSSARNSSSAAVGGTHQGVQTFVTAIAVGNGTKTMNPTGAHKNVGTSTDETPVPSQIAHHHRKMSSMSSFGTILASSFLTPEGTSQQATSFKNKNIGHHRATSSSVSFLQGIDVGLECTDDSFLRNLQASNHSAYDRTNTPSPPPIGLGMGRSGAPSSTISAVGRDGLDLDDTGGTKLASGGTSKRVRRKCTMAGCPNRVVQGGLCISHGAKRKTCKHPGCNKNVKKAGLCSTHGPARKRCDAPGCQKVAVQGGRCIAHGAKKKLCLMDGCTKQAILSGMCKKHHDQSNGIKADPTTSISGGAIPDSDGSQSSTNGDYSQEVPTVAEKRGHKTGHTRGLSIFQEISADAVQSLLNESSIEGDDPSNASTSDLLGLRRNSNNSSSGTPPAHSSLW